MALEQQAKEVESITGERRHYRRYEIHLDLRWKLVRRKRVLESGTGRSLDVSSGGILIEADLQLPVGLNLEVALAWPVLLHDVAPMQLVISGRMVRCDGRRAAIRMVQHEFRTAGVPAENHNFSAMTSGQRLYPLAISSGNSEGREVAFKSTSCVWPFWAQPS